MCHIITASNYLQFSLNIASDSATIIGDEKNSKLLWEPLRGGNISFKIEQSPKNVTEGIRIEKLKLKYFSITDKKTY